MQLRHCGAVLRDAQVDCFFAGMDAASRFIVFFAIALLATAKAFLFTFSMTRNAARHYFDTIASD